MMEAQYLYLNVSTAHHIISTKSYDKWDNFDHHIVTFSSYILFVLTVDSFARAINQVSGIF